MYYHFLCLNPPCKKTPKQRGYDWFCEECDESDEDDDDDEEGGEEDAQNHNDDDDEDDEDDDDDANREQDDNSNSVSSRANDDSQNEHGTSEMSNYDSCEGSNLGTSTKDELAEN